MSTMLDGGHQKPARGKMIVDRDGKIQNRNESNRHCEIDLILMENQIYCLCAILLAMTISFIV